MANSDPAIHREQARRWRRKNADRANESARMDYKKNPEKNRARTKASRDRLRRDVLSAYGGMCACCKEDHQEFLCIDHINGGGTKHRMAAGSAAIYPMLRRLGYPQDEYRLLCHNCNMAIGLYGACPHGGG